MNDIKQAASLYSNLALERLGLRVLGYSDDFFAPASRLFSPSEPVFIPDKFDDHGKWMDGWETRRRRGADTDHDWLIFALGAPAMIHALNLSTRHFTGNYPPFAAVDASHSDVDDDGWTELIPKAALSPDNDHWMATGNPGPWRRLRLRIYPDGGLARLRAHGVFVNASSPGERIDLAGMLNGARVIGYSDAHFGKPDNMLLPDSSLNMGDGWETARRRVPGHDWAVIELGCPGIADLASIATKFFKGNYPASCRLQASFSEDKDEKKLVAESAGWPQLLDMRDLAADSVHKFDIERKKKISHLRIEIYPDGGISRLRLWGEAQT